MLGSIGRGPGPLGRGGRHARQDLVRLAVLVRPPGDDHRRQLVDQGTLCRSAPAQQEMSARSPGSSLKTCIGLERGLPCMRSLHAQ